MFGLRYEGGFFAKHINQYGYYDEVSVEIYEKDYVGDVNYLLFNSEEPLIVKTGDASDTINTFVKASSITLNLVCTENSQYIKLYTNYNRYYKLVIYFNGEVKFKGFLTPEFFNEPFAPPPYEISFEATDNFGYLSELPYNGKLKGHVSCWSLINQCVDVLDLDMPIVDYSNMYHDKCDLSESPLKQIFVRMEDVYDAYDNLTYMDILELCLTKFSYQIFQADGNIYIRSIDAIRDIRDTRTLINIDDKALSDSFERLITINTDRPLLDVWLNKVYLLDSSTLSIQPAAKDITIESKTKTRKNIHDSNGFFIPENWSTPEMMTNSSYKEIVIKGAGLNANIYSRHNGINISKTSQPLVLKFDAEVYRVYDSPFVENSSIRKDDIPVDCGFNLIVGDEIYFLDKEGFFIQVENVDNDEKKHDDITYKTLCSLGEIKKIEIKIQNIPYDGKLVFWINPNLAVVQGGYFATFIEYLIINKIEFFVDIDEDVEIKYDICSAHSNSVSIDLPFTESGLANSSLVDAIYFNDLNENRVDLFYNRNQGNKTSLTINKLIRNIQHYNIKRIVLNANIISFRNISLNTIFSENKYTNSTYCVNSISHDLLNHKYIAKLISYESIGREDTINTPYIDQYVIYDNNVLIRSNNRLFIVDIYSLKITEFFVDYPIAVISPANNGWLLYSDKIYFYNNMNQLEEIIDRSKFDKNIFAKLDNFYFYISTSMSYPNNGGNNIVLNLNKRDCFKTRNTITLIKGDAEATNIYDVNVEGKNALFIGENSSVHVEVKRDQFYYIKIPGEIIMFIDQHVIITKKENVIKAYERHEEYRYRIINSLTISNVIKINAYHYEAYIIADNNIGNNILIWNFFKNEIIYKDIVSTHVKYFGKINLRKVLITNNEIKVY